MRRFGTARTTEDAGTAPVARTTAATPSDAEPDAWIRPEDGDLWQPCPHTPARDAAWPNPERSPLRHLTAATEEQDDLRWEEFIKHIGFERVDMIKPVGFESLSWDHVFPPDRERLATQLEPLVARGDDLESALKTLATKLA